MKYDGSVKFDTKIDSDGFINDAKKMGNIAKKALGGAALAVSTAIGKIGFDAIKTYGDFEQLIGGTELMFGKASDFIVKKSKEAFKNVQMSQNEYLKQVNGFATGLKTSLGGNERAAAELADKIITAEADVVAATGNTQEAVQNAFNGIMKSNYTMLDNLQIGITPTKEGFQEVIDKVNEWNTENGKATSYQINNLADCQSALVDYIEMVGMSGYAQQEASGTIQGSLSTLKASWENLMSGLTDPKANIDVLIDNVFNSLKTFSDNITPRIKEILPKISTSITDLAPLLTNEIMNLIPELLPTIVSGVIKVGETILDNVPTIAPKLLEAGKKILQEIINGVEDKFPALSTTIEAIAGIFAAIKIGTTIQSIVTGFQTAQMSLALFAAQANGTSIATAALNGTLKASEVIVALLTGKLTLAELAQAALTKGQAVLNAVMSANPIALVVIAIGLLVTAFILLWNKCEGFRKFWIKSWDILKDAVSKAIEFIKENWKQVVLFLVNPIAGTFALLYKLNPKFKEWVDNLISSIKQWFSKITSIGKNIVEGIWKGFKGAFSGMIKKIKGLIDLIPDTIKKILGIHSPSTVMRDEVGKYIALGVAVGIEENSDETVKAFKNMLDKLEYQRKFDIINDDEYYAELEKLRDKYFKVGTKEWLEYTQKLYDYQQQQLEDTKAKYKETYKDIYDYASEKIDAVIKKQDDYAKKLKGYGSLFKTVTIGLDEGDITYYSLADIEKDTAEIEKYCQMLEDTKNMLLSSGISQSSADSFLGEISNMSIDEGIKAMEAFQRAGKDELSKYLLAYDKKQSISERSASLFYESDMKGAIDESAKYMKDKLTEAGFEVPDSFFEPGKLAGQNFGDAFAAEIEKLLANVQIKINEFNAKLTLKAQPAFATSGTTVTNYKDYINNYTINGNDSKDIVSEIKRMNVIKRLSGN